ncbi:hypothetical protein CDL15_Pgr007045 [Punica granatum]|uniref:Cytochrome P450 72A15-like n=1 Tax=Punica granatum TaxID=22663 RepID=A0A218X7R7_PUNGR|nr:hypothetical protein CDL15_Pgr007045 [Punica granatum]
MEVALAVWVTIAIILVTCAWKVMVVVWLRPWRLERILRQQGIPGTPYQLGIRDWGETSGIKERLRHRCHTSSTEFSHDIVPSILPFLQRSVQKYGKCFYTWMGPTPVVNVMDGQLLKEIYSRVYDFGKPHPGGGMELLALGLLSSEGEKWSKHRKILNPAFRLERLKPVLAASTASCMEMMSKWEMLLSQEVSCEVDVLPYIDNLTGDILSRAAFGSCYEEGKRIFHLQKEQTDLTFKFFKVFFIPGVRTNWGLKKIAGEIKTLLREIIHKKAKAMEKGEAGYEDLLGLLLESNHREIEESGHEKGYASTSKHHDWQAKAREEILRVFGDKEPDFDSLFRPKTVSGLDPARGLETIPAGTVMYRKTYRATRLDPYYLPSDVIIFVPVLLVHHDQQIWGEDAQVFNPKRFSEGVSKASTGQSRLPYLPFSAGPRVCIGQNFALIEAKAVLAKILPRFSMELSPSYPHAPSNLVTIRPQFGAPLILQKL